MQSIKTSIPNVRDRFEDVLLYTSGYEKVRGKVDESWLKDQQFCKVVRYMTATFCRKYEGLLSLTGHDHDDVHTILVIYSLRFMAMGYKAKDEKARYMFLMRHLSQRFPRFKDLLERKFMLRNVNLVSGMDLSWFSEAPKDEPSGDDDVEVLVEEYQDLRREYVAIKANLSRMIEPKRSAAKLDMVGLRVDMRHVAEEIRVVRTKKEHERSENARITKALRDRLKNTPKDELANKMAYYATVRAVSSDVRDKARQYCRNNGIDYAGWAKRYIERNNFDESEFVL